VRIQNLAVSKYQNLEVVGFWHSHPQWGLELSEADVETFDANFPSPFQIALLLLPHDGTAGIFYRRPSGLISKKPELTFSLSSPTQFLPSNETTQKPITAAPKSAEVEHKRRKARKFLVYLVTLLLLFGLFRILFASRTPSHSQREETVTQGMVSAGRLKATPVEKGVYLTWEANRLRPSMIKQVTLLRKDTKGRTASRTLSRDNFFDAEITDNVSSGKYSYQMNIELSDGTRYVLESKPVKVPPLKYHFGESGSDERSDTNEK